MGIYDNPVPAFAELHPITPTSRRRKAPSKPSQAAEGPSAPTASQTATKVAQDFYDSVNGLVDFQKVRSVAMKAVKAGYEADQVLAAFTRAHQDGRPLTADVLHQYLEGYVQPRGAGRPDKAIHYAADRKAHPSEYSEDL